MGEFIALIDVIPEDTDTDFKKLVEKVDEKLPKECVIETHEVLPVAFGLKKARLRIRYPEEWGGTDRLEKYISQVEGLQGIEAIAFSKA
jgi:translation elongation factor aEF-1 beta